MEAYELVDMTKWKRAMHCQVFRNAIQPMYCICFPIDITNFYRCVKRRGDSFTLAFTYLVAFCANQVEEFRYRFFNGQVVLYPRIHTSFTYLDAKTELFKVVRVDMTDTMEEYICNAKKRIAEQQDYFTGPPDNDVYQMSALPWIPFTQITHTESGKKENAVPIFDWGKFERKNGRVILPFSVQVHHSFVDGIHIAKFRNVLQRELNHMAES